ncbi:MAG: hypothetical protein O7D32_10890, partial [bacterium]|nr:hypothetical protein [bacterium]
PAPEDPYVEALKDMVDGDSNAAFERLQQAVRSGYAPTDAYIKLGTLLRQRGDATRALQIHQSLTVRSNLSKPEKVELFMNLAEDYSALGMPEKAIQVLESAIRNLRIRDPRVILTLARHYHATDLPDKTYNAFKEARKLGAIGDRELALYLASVAECAVEKGELKDARKTLMRGLKYDESCAPCMLLLGNIAQQQDDLDEAINRWKQVAILSPPLSGIALQKLESTLYEKGRFSEVEKVYDDIRIARQGDEASSLALAEFYSKQGRGEDSIHLLEEYVAKYPGSVRGSLLLTSLYSKLRDSETVNRFLDKSIEAAWEPERFSCGTCNFISDTMRWHCPNCNSFDTFSLS